MHVIESCRLLAAGFGRRLWAKMLRVLGNRYLVFVLLIVLRDLAYPIET